MSAPTIRLELAASPHLKGPDSTPRIMWTVVATLMPIVAAALYFFGLGALLVIVSSTLGALACERAFAYKGTLNDGSAAITGILLGLTLPAGFPLWMAFVGGFFGIGFGKLIFGGLGQNVFNPALLGRAFLQAAFPTAITTWPKVSQGWTTVYASNFAWPFMHPAADSITAATPLGMFKFEKAGTDAWPLMVGSTGGSLGETAGLLIILCGAYLAWKRYLNWRIPVSVMATTFVFAGLLHLVSAKFPNPVFMVFSGGLVLGAVYMATDMVTSPITHKGAWVFGAGIAVLVVLIRIWGGLPEGVMYAILIMNAFVPFINRATQPRVFGTPKKSLRFRR
ncbi:MAG TPA: RnfABCDGE type electron transport complex subunit D, partial [Longimicrobiales bacterium]